MFYLDASVITVCSIRALFNANAGEIKCTACVPAVANHQMQLWSGVKHGTYARNEPLGIKLRAKDLIRAIGCDGDAPVAHKADHLLGLSLLDGGAQLFGITYLLFAFHIDQYQIIMTSPEEGDSFGGGQRRVHLETREAQDLVAQWAKRLPRTDVKYSFL